MKLTAMQTYDSKNRNVFQLTRIHQVHQGINSLVEECGPQQGWVLFTHLL